MGPHAFVKNSPLANEAGFVDVDNNTTRHRKYHNVWSAGDAAGLPTSKTAAAITAQVPVLVQNLLSTMKHQQMKASYNGYTSCPLLTEYGKVMLAEFKYDGVPDETFGKWFGIDQVEPRRAFYHLKKDFFPWVSPLPFQSFVPPPLTNCRCTTNLWSKGHGLVQKDGSGSVSVSHGTVRMAYLVSEHSAF